jgi:glycosyltransferase involved in cell wall biosynthesis
MNIDDYIENEVCVCITNFNKALYLEEALNSVIRQKYNGKIHIIIVDDCSQDNSKSIILNFQNMYPKLITAYFNSSNLGIIKNFIKISKLAKGKFISFLDSDDYWIDNHKIQKQVDLIKLDNKVGIIHTNYLIISDNKILNKKVSFIPTGYVYEDLILNNFIIHSSILIKKNQLTEAIEKLEKLNWENFYHNDYPLYLMVSIQAKINYLNEKTIVYRRLESSASHTNDCELRTRIIDSTFLSRIYFIENIKHVSIQTINKIKSNYFYSRLVMFTSINMNNNFFELLLQFYKHNRNFKHFTVSFIIIFKLIYFRIFNTTSITQK